MFPEDATFRFWTERPNWRNPVRMTLEFKTRSFKSRSGREQRGARRAEPRRKFDYLVSVDRADRLSVQRFLMRWQNQRVAVADPTRRLICADGLTSGGTSIVVPSAQPWLAAGERVVLQSHFSQALLEIESFDEETLTVTFTAPSGETWAPGVVMRPALLARFDDTVAMRHPTSVVSEFTVGFDVDPGSERWVPTGPNSNIHAGREVFAKRPNWSTPVDQSIIWPSDTLDFGQGRIFEIRPVAFPTIQTKATFLQLDEYQAQFLTDFFVRQCGQLGEFFMPTWTNDLPLAGDIAADATTFLVQGRTIYDDFANDPVLKHVAFLLTDGRRIYRQISSITLSGGNSLITVTQAFFFAIPQTDVAMISWMPVMRFGSDQMTLQWLTSTVSQCSLAVRSLEALTAEDAIADYDEAGQFLFESWGEDGVQPFDEFDRMVNVTYPGIF